MNNSLLVYLVNKFLIFCSTEIECGCFFVKEHSIAVKRTTDIVFFLTNQTVDILYVSNNIIYYQQTKSAKYLKVH